MKLIGCVTGVIVVNATLGGIAFNYALASLMGKNIPWIADAIIGLFLGEITIPVALICWVIRLCGVPAPFI